MKNEILRNLQHYLGFQVLQLGQDNQFSQERNLIFLLITGQKEIYLRNTGLKNKTECHIKYIMKI